MTWNDNGAYAVKSPLGLLLWPTLSVRLRTTMDRGIVLVKDNWKNLRDKGYRIVRVGELSEVNYELGEVHVRGTGTKPGTGTLSAR